MQHLALLLTVRLRAKPCLLAELKELLVGEVGASVPRDDLRGGTHLVRLRFGVGLRVRVRVRVRARVRVGARLRVRARVSS